MPSTIFYSWQADLANRTNRNFIENCLTKAVKALKKEIAVEDSPRSDLSVDKDTRGVSGSPPIVETIFKKIDECLVFVADMSFVGVRNDGDRPMPNTNIMVEYGYAVKSIGMDRILKVMNVAYGKPESDEGVPQLPFDMRHVRWPEQYFLPEGASGDELEAARKSLFQYFKREIGLILLSEPVNEAKVPTFPEAQIGYAPSTFLSEGEELVTQVDDFDATRKVHYLGALPHAFLRVIPIEGGKKFKHTELQKIATHRSPVSLLKLRGNLMGQNWGINEHGFVIHDGNSNKNLVQHCVQLFLTGEMWTTEADVLIRIEDGPLVLPLFEDGFNSVFNDFRISLERRFNIPPPYRFIVGLTGVKDSAVVIPQNSRSVFNNPYGGICVKEEIIVESVVEEGQTTEDALLPFYEDVWDAYTLNRPSFLYEKSNN